MPQFTDASGITWYYTTSGSNASIGTGSLTINNGRATTSTLSGALIIPSTIGVYPVTSIGVYAFNQGYSGLTSITIPPSITNIGDWAISNCSGLTSLTIHNLVTFIGDAAFANCSGLTNVTIGNKITSISRSAFSSCSALTSVIIPDSVTNIRGYAFYGCTSLTSINIPDSVTNIVAEIPFYNTSANLTITMKTKTFGGVTYTSPSTTDISFFGNDSVTFVLPPLPTMIITSTITSGSSSNNAAIPLTFTTTRVTSDFIKDDISFNRGSLTNFGGSGAVYTATFTQVGLGAYTIYVPANVYSDYAGNNIASTPFTWTFDNISPSITITATADGLPLASGLTTNNAFIALTFTSTKTTTNFVVGDISLTNGVLSNFTGTGTDGTVYTAIFTPTGRGACTINVLQGAYTDAAGNGNIAATQFNWSSTAWNIDIGANHLIKSYIKDFIDVSGSIVLRENSNLYIHGNAETAGNLSLNRLAVEADASFNRRIFVGGDVSMNGNVTVIGDLSMNGSVTKCNLNNSSIPKSAFASTVPDGADYTTTKIVYDQTFQANDDVSMNGTTFASNNVTVSGNIVFGDGTVMNTADNNISTTNAPAFKPSTFTALDICGNLVAGSYATSSDYRIKTNVVELDETYTVDKLRPVKYYQTQINREKYGLIAHELQEHYPDLVIGEKDGSELQRVNYTGLIAILINEIKRMKRELEVLELQQR